ncbi:MAG: HDOD domain-containing protein [Chthonomonas sp.]|nr:HDOD domain-containing protein [Chthonomonas sp.]
MGLALNYESDAREHLRAVLQKLDANADLDHLIHRLVGVVNHYVPSPVVLDRFVCVDPALKLKLLNSVREFVIEDPRRPFESAADIIEIYGDRHVAELTVIMLVDQIHSSVFKGSGYLSRELTKHAVASAATMRWLAKRHGEDEDQWFLYGMCWRIGIPVLCNYDAGTYAKCVSNLMGTGVQLHAAELSMFRLNHRQVTHAIFGERAFPEFMIAAADPDSIPSRLKRHAAFASHAAHKLGFDMGLATVANPILPHHLQQAEIDVSDLGLIRSAVLDAVSDFQRYKL